MFDRAAILREAHAATRRALLQFLAPLALLRPSLTSPSAFTALSPDVALWLRCGRSAPAL